MGRDPLVDIQTKWSLDDLVHVLRMMTYEQAFEKHLADKRRPRR